MSEKFKRPPEHELEELRAQLKKYQWYTVNDHLPRPRKPILMTGKSGYIAPHDKFVISGYYDPEFRPLAPWLDSTSTCVTEMGWEPTHWRYLTEEELL